MPTIRQLAELAGVSHSTVSRALRDNPRISPETVARIKHLAEKHHYRSNRLAQGVLTGKSALLGCLFTDVSLPFESRILRGVLDAAYGESYRVIVQESHGHLHNARQAIHTLIEQRVEGILLTSIHRAPIPRESFYELKSHGVIPVALDFTAVSALVDRVCTDEKQLGELAVDYLAGLGHREIAYIGPPPGGYRGERAEAVRDALRLRGHNVFHVIDSGGEGYLDLSAPHAFAKLLTLSPIPTGIICWEDRMAAKIIQQAARHGYRCPDDISIIGCANTNITEYVTPALTSLEQDPEQMGRRACSLLLQRLADDGVKDHQQPETIHIPPSLVKSVSCAKPRET